MTSLPVSEALPGSARPTKRFDILNALIGRFGYESYLEIGLRRGECFREVKAAHKTSVDPKAQWRATYELTSDEFFKHVQARWDLIFIDGLHSEEQVDKDVANALEHLNDGGTIVVHDCNPPREENQRRRPVRGAGGWNGTVWRSLVRLRATRGDLSVFTVDADWGCGVVRRGQSSGLFTLPEPFTFAMLELHRKEWLGLVSVEQFGKWLGEQS